MDSGTIYLTLVAMAIVTILPRIIPVGFLAGRKMPEWLVTWLKFVPISVLSAMLILDLAWKDEKLALTPSNLMLPAAALGFLVAIRTRNLFATVSAGMAALALLRLVA
jgi:branched-subunit amino acid transport protein